ncbi:MAG: LexA family transcriptional regulator [Oscillospiraceae bacterium]|nr:LexA family transcriptional regulator [Oscillospiraceae bacterium]
MNKKLQLGPALKVFRTRCGLSQQALADCLGVSRNTVINWEADRCRPDYDDLPRLCEVLRVSVPEIFGAATGSPLPERESALLCSYRRLSDAGRRLAENALLTLVEEEEKKRRIELGASFRVFAEYQSAVAAGTGCEFGDTRPRPVFLRSSERNSHADALVRVSGDSMEPVYHDGDYLYFRYANTALPGADVVCSTIRGAVVKRMDEQGGLYSVNPARPFEMKTEADNVRLLGVVTGALAPFDRACAEDVPLLGEIFHPELERFRQVYQLQEWE